MTEINKINDTVKNILKQRDEKKLVLKKEELDLMVDIFSDQPDNEDVDEQFTQSLTIYELNEDNNKFKVNNNYQQMNFSQSLKKEKEMNQKEVRQSLNQQISNTNRKLNHKKLSIIMNGYFIKEQNPFQQKSLTYRMKIVIALGLQNYFLISLFANSDKCILEEALIVDIF
ncbi:hypothetical protein ABPG72_017637 [Tetrahymena utriculariae]